MEIIITKADWGLEYLGDLDARLNAIAEAGFDGIECFFVSMEPEPFKERCSELGLMFNAGVVAPTVDAFRAGIERALTYNPTLINCHGGRDYHTHEESLAFFRDCLKIAQQETDLPVVFETHRRCNLYSPWGTERLLNELPDLRICADFSHFTVVSEGDMVTSVAAVPDKDGMMAQLPDARKASMMALAISRTDHIHARVGDLHRPQVTDPRVGEGKVWCDLFESWWDKIIDRARSENRPFMTINPEYGPTPYTPSDALTGEPLSDHWELAVWSMQRLRQRYA